MPSSSPARPPRIVGVASWDPPFVVSQGEARQFAAAHFGAQLPETERLLPVFDHAGVEQRGLCMPLEWFTRPHGFAERNDEYLRAATRHAEDTIRRLLEQHDLAPPEVDALIFVGSTGLATPTIDARLIGRMGFRPDTSRTPLFGLGCAGGALGLAHAAERLRGAPRAKVVLVNVELCSLTFLHDDPSRSNLVATALFGDGVTATLLVGGDVDQDGFEVVSTGTWLWPDTLDVMGWNFVDHGMQVVFSTRIPLIVRQEMLGCLTNFLGGSEHSLESIAHFVVHPGGTKVLEAYHAALHLAPAVLERSRRILARHGNCSAATVLLVLESLMREEAAAPGDLALLTALGPGFSAGNVLLRRCSG